MLDIIMERNICAAFSHDLLHLFNSEHVFCPATHRLHVSLTLQYKGEECCFVEKAEISQRPCCCAQFAHKLEYVIHPTVRH